MADRLTAARRSVNMSRIRSQDTKPEMLVRRLLHAAGYRYRLHGKDLPGRPDIVFRRRRKVIFVHGCFWHQHNTPECPDSRKPKSNEVYWHAKLKRNAERDIRHLEELAARGWRSLVIWECELRDEHQLAARLRNYLGTQKEGEMKENLSE